MLRKASVVNIGFIHTKKQSDQAKYYQLLQGQVNSTQFSLQAYMKSRSGTVQTYQLLRILRKAPVGFKDVILQLQAQNNIKKSSQQNRLFEEKQIQSIFPQVNTADQQSLSRGSTQTPMSKDFPTTLTKKTFADQIDEYSKSYKQSKNYQNRNEYQNLGKDKIGPSFKQQNNFSVNCYYLIPEKHRDSLVLILSHFLNYKLQSSSGKQNVPRAANTAKRPKTTYKNINKMKESQVILQRKPSTADFQTKNTYNLQNNLTQAKQTQDFNGHLQKFMVMERQLQRKTKKISLLQNQLFAFTTSIREKNIQIKELENKESTLRKKCKYQIDRILKTKAMSDINQIYLTNLGQDSMNGKSVFQINGKKYVKTQQVNIFSQTASITTPKSNLYAKQSHLQTKLKRQDFLSVQAEVFRKSRTNCTKNNNIKLNIHKLNQWLGLLKKQVYKYQSQKQMMLDKLTQDNANVQKNIQKIQIAIDLRKRQIQKCVEQINKIKDLSQ